MQAQRTVINSMAARRGPCYCHLLGAGGVGALGLPSSALWLGVWETERLLGSVQLPNSPVLHSVSFAPKTCCHFHYQGPRSPGHAHLPQEWLGQHSGDSNPQKQRQQKVQCLHPSALPPATCIPGKRVGTWNSNVTGLITYSPRSYIQEDTHTYTHRAIFPPELYSWLQDGWI